MSNTMLGFQSAARLVLLVAFFVFLAEALVMLLMPLIPSHSRLLSALIDATILIIIISPALYFGLFRTLTNIIEQRKRAEADSKKHRNHLEAMVKERTTEISALLEGSHALLKHRQFETSARLIFEKSKETIGAQAGYIALLNQAGTENEIWYLDSGGLPCTVDPSLPMPVRGFRKEAFDQGKAVYENHFSTSQWQQFMPEGHALCENVLFVPLVVNEKPVGLLGLANKPSGFNDNDARIASAFGELASIALLNSRTLESLANSEERFRSVAETALDAIVAIDAQGHVIFWNRSAEKMFGYATDEIESVDQIIPDQFRDTHRTSLKQVVITGQTNFTDKTLRYEGLRKDGTQFPVEMSLASWTTIEGVFFTAIIRDISSQIQAENELRNANNELENRVKERTQKLLLANLNLENEIEERKSVEAELQKNNVMLQAVFDGISEPLILLDKQMRVKIMNKSATDYFGITGGSDPYGKLCYEAAGKSSPCDGCRIPEVLSTGETTTLERKNVDHPERLEQVVIYPLREKSGDAGEVIIRVNDITKVRQFEKQLIQSEKMASLGILVASIAHEINNPNNFVTFNIPILRSYLNEMLPIIDAYAEKHPDLELCQMTYPEFREDIFKLLDNVGNGSARIDSFVTNLREFSQNGRLTRFSWVDLARLSDKVVSMCQNKIRKVIKSFLKDIPEGLSKIHTDPHSLEQVLINLLMNALQAADKPDSWVKLAVSVNNDWKNHTIIQVSDNGCGIDDAIRSRIFDPFFTTKSATEGTGLGLYVCHNLVAGLGGYINVESTAGEGSTFTVTLPDKERRREPRIQGLVTHWPVGGQGKEMG